MVSAARRPFTLEELREAISIEPGNTTWKTAKLVNDVKKSLACCGSLLVIDEELSTIHFAHSSVKQHLETIPKELDITEYHVVPETANLELGKIVVTYLNLEVLQEHLTNNKEDSKTSTAQDHSFVLRTSLPLTAISSSNLARKILKNRKSPRFDVGRELEKVAGLRREPELHPRQAYSLISYAQEHWLSHTEPFDLLDSKMSSLWVIYILWVRLVGGGIRTVELPWTSEDVNDLNSQFLDSVARSGHLALIRFAIRRLNALRKEGVNKMERFLKLLPSQLSFGAEKSMSYSNALYFAVDKKNLAVVRLLLDKTPADINAEHDDLGCVLNVALMGGNLAIVEMLIDYGADVNATGGLYGSVMETAARCPMGKLAVSLLLERGAEEIPIDASYSNQVQEMLRRGYDDHRSRMRRLG